MRVLLPWLVFSWAFCDDRRFGFLGCPWRMFLRLSAGDWTALAGLGGLIVGILMGIYFFKKGFSLGRNRPAHAMVGYIMPLLVWCF